MNLPPFPPLDAAALDAIARDAGRPGAPVTPLEHTGIFNAIYAIGDDLVLRVPRDHPAFIAAIRKEAVAVPAARAAGVRTPPIVLFDDALTRLPVPFAVQERVPGVNFASLDLEPRDAANVWRDVGRDLGRLHDAVQPDGDLAALTLEALGDPRGWPQDMARDGFFSASEARWLTAWLERLEPAVTGTARRFRHGDVQATNVMVRGGAAYAALLDWGACGWGDAAHDFAGVPMRAAPLMLEGHREVSVELAGDAAPARIVWGQLVVALFLLRRGPQPGLSWAERPLGAFMDVARFFAGDVPDEWRAWGPPRA